VAVGLTVGLLVGGLAGARLLPVSVWHRCSYCVPASCRDRAGPRSRFSGAEDAGDAGKGPRFEPFDEQLSDGSQFDLICDGRVQTSLVCIQR
jgi:hypothetical protein